MTAIPYAWYGANTEHPLDLHNPYTPSAPAVPHHKGVRQGTARPVLTTPYLSPHTDAPPHAADHRRAGEVLRVPEVKSTSRFAQQKSHLLLRQVALLFT